MAPSCQLISDSHC